MATRAPDYSSIASKLLEKSRAGKVEWKPGTAFGEVVIVSPNKDEDFHADLAEGFKFEIGRAHFGGDTTYSLIMKHDQGRDVFALTLTDDPGTMINQPTLYETLGELYDIARRKALKIDEKVERVSEILERI